MDTGRWLTHATIWVALFLYVASETVLVVGPKGGSTRVARLLNTVGCVAFLAHVACAFQFYYHWSHAAAYADTALRTAGYFGWNWGGGIYFNYIFLLLWLGQVLMAWSNPRKTLPRAGWAVWSLRAFVLLMIVNGAFIFVGGSIKWFGLLLCVVLLGSWGLRWKHESKRGWVGDQP